VSWAIGSPLVSNAAILESNRLQTATDVLECYPRSFDGRSEVSPGLRLPKPSGLGMVSTSKNERSENALRRDAGN